MEKSFDEYWEKVHKEREWGAYPAEYVIRFVARNYYNVADRSQVKILDFGCGAGAHTWYLTREGFDTYAFDGSCSAIERVKKKLEKEGGYMADLRVRDALELDYPENFFDAVIDNVCIFNNMIKNVRTMYGEVYMMLKPGGKILSNVFGKRTDGYGTGIELEPGTYSKLESGVLKGRTNIHFFDKNELETVLRDCGFRNIIVDEVLYTDNGMHVEQLIAKAVK